jgi:uncharacterized membrane protein YdcZ (DUF606 family)
LHGIGLLLLAVIAGAVVPFQSAINANLDGAWDIRYGPPWPRCW